MADISDNAWSWSATAGSNNPSGSTAIGTGLDDNLRAIQAGVKSLFTQLSSVSGTNTITASAAVAPTAYAAGQRFKFIPANTNTGATTININSLGAKNIYLGGAALIGGEMRASVPVDIEYDGTQFNLMTPFCGTGSFTATMKIGATSVGTGTAKYVKIGNLVNIVGSVGFSKSGTGTVTITGLPFQQNSGVTICGTAGCSAGSFTSSNALFFNIDTGSTTLALATQAGDVSDGSVAGNGNLFFNISYLTTG